MVTSGLLFNPQSWTTVPLTGVDQTADLVLFAQQFGQQLADALGIGQDQPDPCGEQGEICLLAWLGLPDQLIEGWLQIGRLSGLRRGWHGVFLCCCGQLCLLLLYQQLHCFLEKRFFGCGEVTTLLQQVG